MSQANGKGPKAAPVDKFTQRKVKISSQGLFFNNRELEKKANRLDDQRISFFRPFNSAFERNVHTKNKQKRAFNDKGLLNTKDMPMAIAGYSTAARGSASLKGLQSKQGRNAAFLSEMEAGQVIAGRIALAKVAQLQNKGAMKRVLNGYVQNNRKSENPVAYAKTNFVPFVDERDHLGQLIDSEVRTELGGPHYIKKLLVFRPRKDHNKIEIRDDIPRRWREPGGYSEGAHPSPRRGSVDSPLGLGLNKPGTESALPEQRVGMAMSDGFQQQAQLLSPAAFQDDFTSSFNKKSKNYKTLVAAARHMKLPDDKTTNADNQTQVETQASEQNFNRTAQAQGAFTEFGASSPGPPESQKQLIAPTKPKTQQVQRRNQKAQTGSAEAGPGTMISDRGRPNGGTFFSAAQDAVGAPGAGAGDSRGARAVAATSQGSQVGAGPLSMYQPHQSEYSGYAQTQPPLQGTLSLVQGRRSSNQERNVTDLLAGSDQVLDLRYDHLRAENTALETMKKLGMMSGSKQAVENGITTVTENMLGGASKTNPTVRLTAKEEEYVLSQLIQKNFEHRRGLSVFQSKTGRSIINLQKSEYHNGFVNKKIIPPVGIYEHKFGKKGDVAKPGTTDKPDVPMDDVERFLISGEPAPNTCDMKYIATPAHHKAITQAFSCLAETQQVDFTKGQTRDEVSFYKKLARTEQAKALGVDIKDYEDLIKMHKSGKYIINFVKAINPQGVESPEKQDTKNSARRQATEAEGAAAASGGNQNAVQSNGN